MNFLVVVSVPFTTKSRLLFSEGELGKDADAGTSCFTPPEGLGTQPPTSHPSAEVGGLWDRLPLAPGEGVYRLLLFSKLSSGDPSRGGRSPWFSAVGHPPPSVWVPQILRSTISVF